MAPLKTDLCRAFLEHWQSLRTGNALPRLQDFLSQPHPQLQPNVALKDLVPPNLLRVRLFGTRLVDVVGVDLTGQNILDFAGNAEMAEALWWYHHTVATRPVGLASVKLAATASGRAISFEDIELPLEPFPGGPLCVACCLGFVETLDFKDPMLRFDDHLSVRWIDIGWGVPATDTPPGAAEA
ncbi:MAG: PAS domain-containing protein [Rhodospirillaceae bacterium]